MERLGITLDQAGLVGWGKVARYARHLASDQTSHLWRALYPEYADFASGLRHSAIMADLIDTVRLFEHAYVCRTRGKAETPPRQPRLYPRPGQDDGSLNIGKDGIAPSDFDSWYYGGGE